MRLTTCVKVRAHERNQYQYKMHEHVVECSVRVAIDLIYKIVCQNYGYR